MPLKAQTEPGLDEGSEPGSPFSPAQARVAQRLWAQTRLRDRLRLLRRARQILATTAVTIAQAVPCERPGSLSRSVADTLVAEVLPLVEACRFLEREAAWILAPQRLSTRTRPFWLRQVTAETHRESLGLVLVIAPANYPLFLPGVQALQALVAGNAVLWKPAPGGTPAALALRNVLVSSGLDPALLQVLDESTQAAADAIAAGVDKVFLTGSAATGRAVLAELAPHLTPAVMELSGCDAVFVLPGANQQWLLEALAFALRLNGSATCMAPRRLFLVGDHPGLMAALLERLRNLPPVALPTSTQNLLSSLLEDARERGGTVEMYGSCEALHGAVIHSASSDMRITQTDIFAPVLSIFEMPNEDAAIRAHAVCPYALTAAVFGPENKARALAARLPVNTVLINDLVVSTADPRISFGGRKASGFGFTRGREGLLEMTTLKTVVVERSRDRKRYQPTTTAHEPFFAAYIEMAHGKDWLTRWPALRRLVRAAGRLDQ